MAKGDLYIPVRVIQDMRERFESRILKTMSEFDSADEDEDTMTGHLGANLTTHSRDVYVPDIEMPGTWSWSLRYRKFRGRGPGATERHLGADGIIELHVDGPYDSQVKSMLFQSKMEKSRESRDLVEQCAKLSNWREAAAVFSYGPDRFVGLSLDSVLGAKGDLVKAKGIDLAEFLADFFVSCAIGDTELRYHTDKKMLSWMDLQRTRVATRFAIKHRIKISVKRPSSLWSDLQGVNEISADEIIRHRMAINERDMLGVDWKATHAERKAAQKAITRVYHPDMWHGWPDPIQAAMEARTKEVQGLKIKKDS